MKSFLLEQSVSAGLLVSKSLYRTSRTTILFHRILNQVFLIISAQEHIKFCF